LKAYKSIGKLSNYGTASLMRGMWLSKVMMILKRPSGVTLVALLAFIGAIAGVCSFYLTRPHVKSYFGFGQPGGITSTLKESKRTIVSL
jgi:hypothetical protein